VTHILKVKTEKTHQPKPAFKLPFEQKDKKDKKKLISKEHKKNLDDVRRKIAIYKQNKNKEQQMNRSSSRYVFLDNRISVKDFGKEKIK
jgi:hypothetical protein